MHRKLYKRRSTLHFRAEKCVDPFVLNGPWLPSSNVASSFDQVLCSSYSAWSVLYTTRVRRITWRILGGVINKDGKFIAKIDTSESGTRFAMVGPPRDDEQQAVQDLSFIRAAADGETYAVSAG